MWSLHVAAGTAARRMARTHRDGCPVGSAKSPLCLWLPPTPTSIWRRLLDKPKRHRLKGRPVYPPAKGIWRAVAAALSSELSASPVHECVDDRTTRFPFRSHRAGRWKLRQLLLKYPVLWNKTSFKYQSLVFAGRLVTAGAPSPVRLQHAGVVTHHKHRIRLLVFHWH